MNGHLWSVDLTTRATTALTDTKVPALEKVKNLALDTSTGAIASTTNGGKVTVVAAYPLPATVELPAAQVGKAYSQKLTAADTRAAFALTNGTLPGGLSLAQDGTISGTPTAVGSDSRQARLRRHTSRSMCRDRESPHQPLGPGIKDRARILVAHLVQIERGKSFQVQQLQPDTRKAVTFCHVLDFAIGGPGFRLVVVRKAPARPHGRLGQLAVALHPFPADPARLRHQVGQASGQSLESVGVDDDQSPGARKKPRPMPR